MVPEQFPREYGGYRLISLLGSGGSADVYRAELPAKKGETPKEVAIRRVARGVDADQHVLQVLFEESRVWVTLRHPNIVSVVDIGQHDGDCFLVLELVDGVAASQMLLVNGPLPIDEAFCICADVAEALHYGHAHSIAGRPVVVVHRDVKPANVLVSVSGEVKLTDFGIARTNDRLGRTKAGVVRGSLHYLSPEQVRKEPLTPRTDLFALGCLLHALVAGRPLLDLPKEAIFRMLNRGDVPPPDEALPGDVRALIGHLTAAKPENRPETGREVAERLRRMLGSRAATARGSLGTRAAKVRERMATTMGEAGSATSTLKTMPVGAIDEATRTTPRRR